MPRRVLLSLSALLLTSFTLLTAAEVNDASAVRKRVEALRHAVSPGRSWVAAFNGESYLFNPDAGVEKAPFLSGVFKPFGFSFDGRYFLYLKANGKMPTFRLQRYDLNEGTEKELVPGGVHFAFPSPVNHDVAYVSMVHAASFRLFLYHSATGVSDLLAEGMLQPESIEWSSDGSALLYSEVEPQSRNAVHTHEYRQTVNEYSLASGKVARSFEGAWARYSADDIAVAGARGARALPDAAAEDIKSFVVTGGTTFATVLKNGHPVVKVHDFENSAWREVATGTIYAAVASGVVVREVTPAAAEYKLMSSTGGVIQKATFTNTWELPFSGSAFMVQGGSLFKNGACDGSVCSVVAHTGTLGFALDWQQTPEAGQGNKHILATADGTVAATYNTVTCNSATRTCTSGIDPYSATCNDPNQGAGNYVVVAHPDGTYSFYGHLRSGSVQVSANQAVAQGDYLADQGHSGSAASPTGYLGCGDHVHFQRQSSPAIWAQSSATDFTELPCSLTCLSSYVSNNVENNTAPVSSLTVLLTPSTIAGGGVTQANKVVLPAPAPVGGATVSLTSSVPSVATVPATVTVPQGMTSAVFAINAATTSATATSVIQADYNSQIGSATLTVAAPGLSGLVLSATSIAGGMPLNGNNLVLTTTASAPVTISLSSSDPSIIAVPPTATVPAGATSVLFNASTYPVPISTRVTITATLNGVSYSGAVSVKPTAMSSLLMTTASVIGGNSTTARVSLSGTAAAGGAVVTLTSSNTAVATLPASITVAEGMTISDYFTISTVGVASATPVTISAAYGGVTKTAVLTVQPLALSTISLNPASVAGGGSVTGTVSLTGPAPVATTVALTTTNATVAPVPPSVTVPTGQASATFTITTSQVGSPTNITIGGSSGGVSKTAALTVSVIAVSSLNLSPTVFTGGRTTTANQVVLNGPAPAGGVTVALSSSNPGLVSVPASVSVAAGSTTSPSFNIVIGAVAADTPVTITGTYGGTSAQRVLTVQPPALTAITMTSTSIAGGSTSTGNTVRLTAAAPTGGIVVSLSSSNPSVASVPASVTVPEGATTSAGFSITTTQVSAATPIQITSTFNGVSKTASITVGTLALSSVVLSPTAIASGTSSTGNQVRLNGPAPAGGMTVSLASSNPSAATVPASVTVAAGATSANFTITAASVATVTTTIITATSGSTNVNATLTVNPSAVQGVGLSPSSIIGGKPTSSNRITMTGPAPAGGAVITLASSDPSIAQVPASITVPAGANTSPYFTITTSAVPATTGALITATLNGKTVQAWLTVENFGIKKVSVIPATIVGGNTGTMNTIMLNDVAPAGGIVVALSSSNPAVASVPATVPVAGGSMNSVWFRITTTPVTSATQVTITATYGGQTRTGVVTVQP